MAAVDAADGKRDVSTEAAGGRPPGDGGSPGAGGPESGAAAAPLRGKQRRYLRGLGVNLPPQVMVGKDGISADVLAALDAALTRDELVKVRLQETAGEDRKAIARDLADRAGVELVQVLGRTVLLWRRNEEEPRITLPD